ncbi:MAG: hypothetical protein MK110_05690 [Fuerstiella sp.]|nr:hypothetical protein [Fuerstiella sp.]
MKRQKTIVRVQRVRGLARDQSRITVEHDGQRTEYSSVDQLPDEFREFVDEFITGDDDSSGFNSQAFADQPGMRRGPSVNAQDGTLVLHYRWFDGWLFCGLLVLVPYFSYQCYQAVHDPLIFLSVMGWAGTVFLLTALYYTAALLLNTTVIEVCPQFLSVLHTPLPWVGSRKVAAASIVQIFYTVHYSRRGGPTYSLKAMTETGQHLQLIGGASSKHEVIRLELAIEKYLGIQDWPRFGE